MTVGDLFQYITDTKISTILFILFSILFLYLMSWIGTHVFGCVWEADVHFKALGDSKKSIFKKLWHFFGILFWGLIFIILLGIAIWVAIWVVIEIYQGVVIAYQRLF